LQEGSLTGALADEAGEFQALVDLGTSGGSGIWNGTLDFVRVIKQQKEAVLQRPVPTAGNS